MSEMETINEWLNKNEFPKISDELIFALKYQTIVMSLYEMLYLPIDLKEVKQDA